MDYTREGIDRHSYWRHGGSISQDYADVGNVASLKWLTREEVEENGFQTVQALGKWIDVLQGTHEATIITSTETITQHGNETETFTLHHPHIFHYGYQKFYMVACVKYYLEDTDRKQLPAWASFSRPDPSKAFRGSFLAMSEEQIRAFLPDMSENLN